MELSKPAVLFIIFNRTDTTSRVFEEIRKFQPQRLYVAADGPRPDFQDDIITCKETRKIINKVDWDCTLQTRFQDENLGPKYGVAAAIDWFFQHEEDGIILEHDCLPSQSFFTFCASLLMYYRSDPRVMHITGCNLQFGQQRGNASYYFSNISSIWGWASWRRVWNLYDVNMSAFPEFTVQDLMINIFPERTTADWVTNMARQVYYDKIMSWDYPLGFAILINNGLCVTPNVNLVSNIGFGDKAVHTKDASHPHANIPIHEIGEISHPKFFIPDRAADLYQLSLSMPKPNAAQTSFLHKVKNKIKGLIV